MKKLFKFLPMLAIVAGLGLSLSAFTSAKPTHQQTNVRTTPLFWYPVDITGEISGPAFNAGGSAMELADAILSNPQLCDNSQPEVCYVGEATNNYEQTSTTPSAPTADNRLTKSN
ncbi:hypothetical protein [Pedobacter sp. ASV28]|uniref:hypothetical protein n=1 Tax=Pedobacter sp. ASV28 TaxID=2795123 RepID=UPI0018ED3527|nr:hypothetical protein [Pedobacter sp. ASV28]